MFAQLLTYLVLFIYKSTGKDRCVMNQCNEITSWEDATFNFIPSFQNLVFYFYICMAFNFILHLM